MAGGFDVSGVGAVWSGAGVRAAGGGRGQCLAGHALDRLVAHAGHGIAAAAADQRGAAENVMRIKINQLKYSKLIL